MNHKAEDEELPDLMMNINNDEEAKNDSREFEPVILHINNTLNGLVVFSSTVSKEFEEFVIMEHYRMNLTELFENLISLHRRKL